jgi:PAS domain S-box-containing protein
MDTPTNGGRARAYAALRESEELHRATLSQISDAVFLADDEGAFTYICPNVDVIFGYVPDEVQAMARISALLGSNLFDPAELAARGEIQNIEREIAAKSGKRRTLLVHVKAVSIGSGTVLYCCRDITERKRAEELLRAARLDLAQASRLALAGELVASITHEIAQPLTAILGNAEAGLNSLAGGAGEKRASLRAVLSDIRDQGRFAVQIIERLRALVRKVPLELRPLDVNEVLGELLRLVETEARRRGMRLRVELAPALQAVDADRVSLQQVVLNLIVNAMDAMERAARGQREVLVQTLQRRTGVEIAVSDAGAGLAPERMPKLFDAFFTTKEEGMGLGLAIARSIVEAHGGDIWAEDRGRSGATFRVWLPAAA